MSRTKKQKTGFRRRSIWPSILLFLFSLVMCVSLISAFFYLFEFYMMESKLLRICDTADQLARIISERAGEDDFLEAVEYARGYLASDADLCITDKDGTILECSGVSRPDFSHKENLEISDSYIIYADVLPDSAAGDGTDGSPDGGSDGGTGDIRLRDSLMAPPKDLFEKTVQMRGGEDMELWLNENLFSDQYWVQIPVREDSYNLYYKGTVSFIRQDTILLFAVGVVALIILIIPMILLFVNVVSVVVTQKRMIKMMYLDTVTGGNNWDYFIQKGRFILKRIRNVRVSYAVVNLHLDRYQDYCACFGSRAGEELLKNINGYLQVRVGKGEAFARFAKADFGLLLRCTEGDRCEKRLRKLLAELTGIHKEQKINYHAGVCLIPAAAGQKAGRIQYQYTMQQRRKIDLDQLFQYANAARKAAQKKENNIIALFDRKILDDQLWRRKVEDTMEAAVQNGEFKIYLQPKYNPLTGRLVGAEALARWISPKEGFIEPARFIPIFEDNGFITRLDDYMISGVAKLLSEWKIQGRKIVPVSVNVSRANFTRADLAEHICRLVDGYGVQHGFIELEVTESAFFGDKQMLQKIIKELKMYGFHVSMDDFGAGYSSLNSLKDLPIDVLKLDMEFFHGEDREKRGEIVVRETIQLAKNLDMKIVAEGIEKREQVDFLAQQGCDMIQGYYYAKPMPVAEFDELVLQDA